MDPVEGASDSGRDTEEEAFEPPSKSPLYEAFHNDRYHRQDLIRAIQSESDTDAALLSYVGGARTRIERDDVLGFADLLCRVKPGRDVDLLLHSGGGDIDAAEKLITMVRERVKNGSLRVIVPHYAKSAATLMALGAHSIVMSDSSELGPIDPQVPFPDGEGNRVYYSAFSYLKAFERFSAAVKGDPDDPNRKDDPATGKLMLAKFQPHELVEVERVMDRTRYLAEKLLQFGMMAGGPPPTALVSKLMDNESWYTHGQVISAEDALEMGLTIEPCAADDAVWTNYWRLYCLQRLEVNDRKKLFESAFVSLSMDGAE